LILPETLKKWILFNLYPEKAQGHDGFEAFYDKCTPKQLTEIAKSNGLEVVSVSTHWRSSYFSFFFPFYIVWRLWTLIAKNVFGGEFCESFVVVLRKIGQ
jgi:2-polyprenyl-6-hydroxyphenyl methylase/3-demethylubiquinone-9 3-methyltransferase